MTVFIDLVEDVMCNTIPGNCSVVVCRPVLIQIGVKYNFFNLKI